MTSSESEEGPNDINLNTNKISYKNNKEFIGFKKALAERDKKILSLSQALLKKKSQLKSLHNEYHSLSIQFEKLLNSRSWKLTRPLRSGMAAIRHTLSFTTINLYIYNMAKKIGRKLPFPPALKSLIHKTFLERMYRNKPAIFLPKKVNSQPLFDVSEYVNDLYPFMRPQCCGLIEGLVSVVLPVYNQANLITESIESVLSQTYENFELIIINDGSTDAVENVLERYLDNPRVRCFTQKNQGLPKALSNGFSIARGELWTWTSADNFMEPQMLEMLVQKLRAEPDIEMTYADYYAIDDSGNILQDPTWRASNRPDPNNGQIRLPHTTEALNIVDDNFIGPCFMYRGWVGRCLGDYDTQLGVEDYDYWMRINAFFSIQHLGKDSLLYFYRVHKNSLSAKAQEHKIFEKVKKLMKYEKDRAIFYENPLIYVADAIGTSWLQANEMQESEIHSIENNTIPQALAVIGCEYALKNQDKLLRSKMPTALIISQSDFKYHKLARLINSGHCIVLANDKDTADRIMLLSSNCPMVDASSFMALKAIQAFTKNLLFIQVTRKQEEFARQMPRLLYSKNKYHIVLQVDNFIRGGLENVVLDLALSLKRTGYLVTILNLGKSGEAAEKAKELSLNIEILPPNITEEVYQSFMINNNVNLVNSHFSLFGAAVCFKLGIPFIQTIHNSYVWLSPVEIDKYRDADRYTSQYISVSLTAARYADIAIGLDVSKMRVITNGVDQNVVDFQSFELNRANLRRDWGVTAETPVYLNVASIHAAKAQLPLIRAFVQVVEKLPEARLVLVGGVIENSYYSLMKKFVHYNGLEKNVVFAGYHEKIARFYHASDVFVLPSFWEGWSLALGEAILNGLTCIITDVGSSNEFECFENVEIIEPPFGDIVELNYWNQKYFLYGEDISFQSRLANAMIKHSVTKRSFMTMPLTDRFDRDIAYQKYAEVFAEIITTHRFNKEHYRQRNMDPVGGV